MKSMMQVRYEIDQAKAAAREAVKAAELEVARQKRITESAPPITDLSSVASVYSGKNGRCCCGCSGKYRYARAHRDWSSKNRGYAVDDEDVSDRSVAMIVRKINAAECRERAGRQVCAVIGDRLYMATIVD